MRDRRHPGVWWPGASRHRVGDEGQRTAGLQHVVHGLGHSLLVCPVEGLTEGRRPVRPWRDRGQVLGQALDPPDVQDSLFLGCAAALRKHAGVGVQARPPARTDERGGRVSTPATPHGPQHAAVPIESRSPASGRPRALHVRGAAVAIVGSRAEIDGRVIRHRTSVPRSTSTARPLRGQAAIAAAAPTTRFCGPGLNNYGVADPIQAALGAITAGPLGYLLYARRLHVTAHEERPGAPPHQPRPCAC